VWLYHKWSKPHELDWPNPLICKPWRVRAICSKRSTVRHEALSIHAGHGTLLSPLISFFSKQGCFWHLFHLLLPLPPPMPTAAPHGHERHLPASVARAAAHSAAVHLLQLTAVHLLHLVALFKRIVWVDVDPHGRAWALARPMTARL
jgi:hypothetical protein